MSNVRFVLASGNAGRRVGGSFPRTMNGLASVPTPPSDVADAANPMSNFCLTDRYDKVVAFAAPVTNLFDGTLGIDVDLGAVKTVVAVGLHGLAGYQSTGGSFSVQYRTASYDPATGWLTDIPPIAAGSSSRDPWALITPRASRYWRFRFAGVVSGFQVSSGLLATTINDLGYLYARGEETVVTPRTVVECYGGVPIITRTGGSAPTFRRWVLTYPNNELAARQLFDLLNQQTTPFAFLTPEDELFEAVFENEEFQRAHIFDPGGRYEFAPALRSLP